MNPQQLQRWQWARARFEQRQFADAIRDWEEVLAAVPGHLPTLLWLGRAHGNLGHYRASHAAAMTAYAAQPREPEMVHELISRLRNFNELPAMLDCARHIDAARWPDKPLLDAAMWLSSVAAHEPALQLVETILRRNPQSGPVWYLRGTIKMFFGDNDEAERSLERAIALVPQMASAHWVLSQLRRTTPEHHHVPRLQHELSRVEPGSEYEGYLNFALHNELHDLQRFDESWAALERGSRVKRARNKYQRSDSEAMFAQLKATCSAEFCAQVAPDADEDAPTPIFVIGMHRSGTTLLEQILGGHSQITDAGETYVFPAQLRLATDRFGSGPIDLEIARRAGTADFAAIARSYHALAPSLARGKPWFTEKLPSNYLNAGFIAKALPRAKFLHMVRDPRDVCFSNLRTFFSNVNGFSYDQIELAAHYAQYRELMTHWHTVMPGRVLDVSYNALVRDSDAEARRVMAFIDLPFEPTQLQIERKGGAVATASSTQVRAGIRVPGAPAWLPYEARLQPLFDELARLNVL